MLLAIIAVVFACTVTGILSYHWGWCRGLDEGYRLECYAVAELSLADFNALCTRYNREFAEMKGWTNAKLSEQ